MTASEKASVEYSIQKTVMADRDRDADRERSERTQNSTETTLTCGMEDRL